MDRVVGDFVALLRRHRVRVSPAEGLDALEGLRLVGLAEREGVRDTLRTTLVKSGEDIATFERLFDLYFGLQPQPVTPARVHPHVHDNGGTATELRFGEDLEGDPDDGDHDHSHAGPEPIDLRRFLDEDKLRPSHDIHGESERLRLSVFGQHLMLNRNPDTLQKALRSATHQLRVKRARSFNPGAVAPEAGAEELPVELPPVGFDELVDELRELGVDERLVAALAAQADDILRALPELLKELLERRRRLAASSFDDEEITRRSLRTLLDLPPADQAELEAAVRRLGRQIHGARGRRLKPDRVGRISVPQTLRRNLSYEGVPFEPVLRRRREQRPRLVVLCDVSLSTRNLARFWLHLVYGLQGLFSKVRTFVFVADVAEVTQLFEAQTLERAVETIFSGSLIDVDENSDFGKAAEQLASGLEAGLGRRTTVVVLGDGRNNGRPANASALEEIAARARRLIWITPEPKWGWTLGGCDMPLYERICTRVEVVRNAEELGAVAETLVRDATAPGRRRAVQAPSLQPERLGEGR
ncbi:MAG TPA: VWA domain-containing protein [Thermoleophilaceae bacterium]|nr:VWA domain-containing protein [Thermoleophilaceae bacterium]